MAITGVVMGCGQKRPITPTDPPVSSETQAPVAKPVKPDTILAGNGDTTLALQTNEAFIKGEMVANTRQPVYSIPVLKGEIIIAWVRPENKGSNVRINQVQQPGGSFDGPFGDSLYYDVKKSGMLRFIIGQNLMAGDPWSGKFIFHLRRKTTDSVPAKAGAH